MDGDKIMGILKSYKKSVRVHQNIVKQVAKNYKDPNRSICEFVDNSIDSADKNFLTSDKEKYSEEIKVSINIYKDKVVIKDNAFGMDKKTTEENFAEIGLSDKKNDFTTNGEKGFGIYSFLAWCENLSFSTSTKEEAIGTRMQICEADFETTIEDFAATFSASDNEIGERGTTVELSNIKEDNLKKITAKNLHRHISDHFNSKLKTKDFLVTIQDHREKNASEITCEPFDFDDVEGESVKYKEFGIGKKGHRVSVDIKIAKEIKRDHNMKRISIIKKGRRVCYLKDVFGIKTHKTIWSNERILGEIHIPAEIEIDLTREDIQKTKNWDEVTKFINDVLEPEVKKKLDLESNKNRNKRLQMNDPVIAKFFKEYIKELDSEFEKEKRNPPVKPSPNPNPNPNPNPTPRKPTKVKAGGVPQMKWKEGDPMIKYGIPQKSIWLPPNTIVIYTDHEEFKRRSQDGVRKKTSDRELAYIATEVMPHLIDIYYASKKQEFESGGEDRKAVLRKQSDGTLKMEDFLINNPPNLSKA